MIEIDAALVVSLVGSQFPQWAELAVVPVAAGGWDNRTFRLGQRLLVRLPSAERYVAQVAKEQRWLPLLAPRLPLPIPAPVALGAPGAGYPWPWSVYRWLDGEPARAERIADQGQFARDLAGFLTALQAIDAADGPAAGAHNFHRGGRLQVYDDETRRSIATLADELDVAAVAEVWDAALASRWRGRPVWVHGDVAEGNFLLRERRLGAMIDFGSSGVGDPACDLVIAWTLLDRAGRNAFRAALPLDGATWARGRGWALWKALITIVAHRGSKPGEAAKARLVIRQVLADHAGDGRTT